MRKDTPQFIQNSSKINILRLYLASEKISENMHIIANDPSLAFYRMQEHIRKGTHNSVNFFPQPSDAS